VIVFANFLIFCTTLALYDLAVLLAVFLVILAHEVLAILLGFGFAVRLSTKIQDTHLLLSAIF
jgi:hypothetical protein